MSEPEQARLDLGPIEPGSYDGVQQAIVITAVAVHDRRRSR